MFFNGESQMDKCDYSAPWYHGSPEELDLLRAGSWITQFKEVAKAFSHRPTLMSLDDDSEGVKHDGKLRRAISIPFMIVLSLSIGCSEKQMLEKKGSETMVLFQTERTTVRGFTEEDWPDIHELAKDWRKAPGPEFDKWPTSENDAKGLAGYFAEHDNFKALCLRDGEKVIGLLGLNGLDSEGRFDLGHVILSAHQDNDIDKEALKAMVEYILTNKNVESIVTNNASSHTEQLAPLRSIGFKVVDQDNPGTLVLTKAEWEQQQPDE